MTDVLARFVANQPPNMRREVVRSLRPDLLPQMEAWGPAWRELCAELGVPCPDLLVALGDAMADVCCYFEIDGESYAMLTPREARDARADLTKWATTTIPALAVPAAMLPVFGEDGTLLIAADGRIYRQGFEESDRCDLVADNLGELLDLAAPGALNPEGPA